MTVRTVMGDISASDLGITLCHEHVFVDATQGYWNKPDDPEKQKIAEAPVSIDIMDAIRREICLNKDNLVWDSFDDALSEFRKYKAAGGKSIADVSWGQDIRERPLEVKEISKVTGISIMPSTGWYISATHPSFVSGSTVEQLSDIMVKELTEGIGNSTIRANLIGELGCSGPLHPDEKKILLAGAKAQYMTGAPLTVHVPHFDYTGRSHVREAHKYVEILGSKAILEKVYLSHMDFAYHIDNDDLDYQKRIMDKGLTISYDRFGLEGIYDEALFPGALEACTDTERINGLVTLCSSGYEKNLMLSHDACMKMQFTKYGGYGYAHILNHVIPIMKSRGVTDAQIRSMMIDNPKRIFDW